MRATGRCDDLYHLLKVCPKLANKLVTMSSRLPPAKRPRRSPTANRDSRRPSSSTSSKQRSRDRDPNQLTITSLLLGSGGDSASAAKRRSQAPGAGGRSRVGGGSGGGPCANTDTKSSEDVLIVDDKDDDNIIQHVPPSAATRMAGKAREKVQPSREAGEICDDDHCVNRTSLSRDVSPELFSDPAAGEEGESENAVTDNEGVRGKHITNTDDTTKHDSEEVPGNQDVIEIPSDSDGAAVGDDDESTVKEKSPYSIATSSSRSKTHSPEIDDIPPWDGTPLSEIRSGPSTYPVLPPLQASATHAVLFRPRLKPGQPPTPFPEKFKDVWDTNHVRMPCSSQSVYPVATTSFGSTSASGGASATKTLVPRWDIIKESLKKPIANSYDLEEAILTYNTHYAKRWNFYGLHSYFNDHCSEEESQSFFGSVLPRVIDLALSLPSLVTHALPLLKKQLDYSVSLSQQQVACLLANAFLCTFPRRNARGVNSEYASYPSINFNTLFSGSTKVGVSPVAANKLTCIFHYFTR